MLWKCYRGFPGGASGKEPACQCRRQKRCRFHPWVGKTPCRRAWQLTPVFLPGRIPWTEEPAWRAMVHRVTKSHTRLKDLAHTHVLHIMTTTTTIVTAVTIIILVESLAPFSPGCMAS